MAYFEGTIEEFTKFVGAYARIKVMHLAKKHKKNLGRCEDCGSQTKSLEAAHIRGFERPRIISKILSEFLENEVVKLDLDEFEERFIDAHTPIEKTIRILCKECHLKYDKREQVNESMSSGVDLNHDTDNGAFEREESAIINKIIREQLIDKTEAIDIINAGRTHKANHENTIYSNINASKDVWWLEPNNKKFENDFNIILHYPETRTLYHFHLPGNTIENPLKVFNQRKDRQASKIYIGKSQTKFTSDTGYDFTRFLVDAKEY